jgi:hypothetical protein
MVEVSNKPLIKIEDNIHGSAPKRKAPKLVAQRNPQGFRFAGIQKKRLKNMLKRMEITSDTDDLISKIFGISITHAVNAATLALRILEAMKGDARARNAYNLLLEVINSSEGKRGKFKLLSDSDIKWYAPNTHQLDLQLQGARVIFEDILEESSTKDILEESSTKDILPS